MEYVPLPTPGAPRNTHLTPDDGVVAKAREMGVADAAAAAAAVELRKLALTRARAVHKSRLVIMGRKDAQDLKGGYYPARNEVGGGGRVSGRMSLGWTGSLGMLLNGSPPTALSCASGAPRGGAQPGGGGVRR